MACSAKRKGTGVNVGSVSILVVFVLLCLTTFATLSLASSNADLKLTKNAADSLSSFYIADAKAEDMLASIDGRLKAVTSTNDKQSYFSACSSTISDIDGVLFSTIDGALTLSYTIFIDEKKELQVNLTVLYPAENNLKRYKLTKWQIVNIGDWEADESLNLLGGEALNIVE